MDLAEGQPTFAGRGQKPSNKQVLAAIASIKQCRQGSFFNPAGKKPCSCGWHTKAAARKQARQAQSDASSSSRPATLQQAQSVYNDCGNSTPADSCRSITSAIAFFTQERAVSGTTYTPQMRPKSPHMVNVCLHGRKAGSSQTTSSDTGTSVAALWQSIFSVKLDAMHLMLSIGREMNAEHPRRKKFLV